MQQWPPCPLCLKPRLHNGLRSHWSAMRKTWHRGASKSDFVRPSACRNQGTPLAGKNISCGRPRVGSRDKREVDLYDRNPTPSEFLFCMNCNCKNRHSAPHSTPRCRRHIHGGVPSWRPFVPCGCARGYMRLRVHCLSCCPAPCQSTEQPSTPSCIDSSLVCLCWSAR